MGQLTKINTEIEYHLKRLTDKSLYSRMKLVDERKHQKVKMKPTQNNLLKIELVHERQYQKLQMKPTFES